MGNLLEKIQKGTTTNWKNKSMGTFKISTDRTCLLFNECKEVNNNIVYENSKYDNSNWLIIAKGFVAYYVYHYEKLSNIDICNEYYFSNIQNSKNEQEDIEYSINNLYPYISENEKEIINDAIFFYNKIINEQKLRINNNWFQKIEDKKTLITNTDILEYGYNDFFKFVTDGKIDKKFIYTYVKNEYDNQRINVFYCEVVIYTKGYYLKTLYDIVDENPEGLSFDKKEVDTIIMYHYIPIDYIEFMEWYIKLKELLSSKVIPLWMKSDIALKLPNSNFENLVFSLSDYVSNPRLELLESKRLHFNAPKELTPEQIDDLADYFSSSFKGMGSNSDLFSVFFIKDLNTLLPYLKPKDCARIAVIIFNSTYFKTTKKEKLSFKDWLQEFYKIMGISYKDYKQSKLKNDKKYSDLEKKFSYLNI